MPPVVAEVWAGLRTLSGLFESQHGFSVGALCEIDPQLLQLAAHRHPDSDALVQGDFYKLDRHQWKQALDRVHVVTGGPSCVTLSTAGKMQMASDPRSGQLMDTAELAIFLRARALLLENVYNLVDLDSEHALLSTVTARLRQENYSQVHVWKLRHDYCGGGSQRPRVFIFWLEDAAALALSPLVGDDAPEVSRPIRHFLRKVST